MQNIFHLLTSGPFSIAATTLTPTAFAQQLLTLDVGTNEITQIPGLDHCINLQHLNISRNWFNQLPPEIAALQSLVSLNARRNFLRPNDDSLQLSSLASLPNLSLLDLQWNAKLKRLDFLHLMKETLPQFTTIQITVQTKIGQAPPGSFVGASPKERNATLLRSQLEPYNTLILRRRLENIFHQPKTNSENVLRAELMTSLLKCYANEKMLDVETGVGTRPIVNVDGILINDNHLLSELYIELKKWSKQKKRTNQNRNERPSINASNYMIIRSPLEFEPKLNPETNSKRGSRKAKLAKQKYIQYIHLWNLAQQAMMKVNPSFAKQYTALAVTHNFTGSPHIDKQNITPFYGLSIGNFQDGEGGIRVEYNARCVVNVNTKNRLGRIDGRYPHWVAPYGGKGVDRYSLIYYQTEGVAVPKGEAVPGLVL